jgi:tetratricopeptide (TPR) repeat protein
LEFTGYLPFFVKDKEYRSLFYINQKSRERLHSSDFPTALFQSKEVISTASSADNSSTNKIKRYLQPILALSVILGLALAIAYYFGFLTIDFQDKTNAGYDNPFEQPSILIVPFASADQDSENLAVGLADALAQRLGNLKALQVLSPSTGRMFANSTPEEIYAATSARMLMRGKIDSAAPQPNVYVELIDCRESKTLWSTNISIENRNFFALQKEISFELVAALKLNPLPTESQQLDKYPTLNNEAYENYLLGRSYLAKRSSDGLKKAIEKFSKAIELDGNFSLAYSGLSDAYSLLNLYEIEPPKDAYQMASKYAEKALELDPGLAEAHASLAYIKFFYERDRATSELEFRRAIQLNPSYAQAHHWFALVLVAMGKPLDAEAEIKIAERLDPQSPLVQTAYAMIYFFSGKENEALEKISQVLIKNPDFLPAIKVKRWTEQALKNFPEAHNAFLEEIRVTQSKPDDPSWQMIAVQTFKVTNDNLKQLEDRLMKDVADKKISQNYHSFAYEISLAYLNLGNIQKALEWLDRAEQSSNYSFNFLEVDPRLKPLNNNPRFLLLIKKLKSPVKHQA